MKRLGMALAALGLVVGAMLAPPASATPTIYGQFRRTILIPPGTPLARAQCRICHTSPPVLNPFGRDVQAALRTQATPEFTTATWKRIRSLDSDKDGFTNREEIREGTLPGDPNSRPSATVRPERRQSWIESLLNPENAYHPVIVHFPIALFFASLLLDALGELRRDPAVHVGGFYNLALAVLGALAAVTTGYLAMTRLHLRFQGTMERHALLAVTTTTLMIVLYAIRVHRHARMRTLGRVIYLIVGLMGVVALALTGHYGGVLVYGS